MIPCQVDIDLRILELESCLPLPCCWAAGSCAVHVQGVLVRGTLQWIVLFNSRLS